MLVVLLTWGVAAAVAVLVLALVGVEMLGHLTRLRRAVGVATGDILPRVRDLAERAERHQGRHRADP